MQVTQVTTTTTNRKKKHKQKIRLAHLCGDALSSDFRDEVGPQCQLWNRLQTNLKQEDSLSSEGIAGWRAMSWTMEGCVQRRNGSTMVFCTKPPSQTAPVLCKRTITRNIF